MLTLMTSALHSVKEPFLESMGIELGFEGRPGFTVEWVFQLDSMALPQTWSWR